MNGTYLALVEARSATARKGRKQDDDAVVGGVAAVVRREGGVAEEALARATGEADGVDVEVGPPPLAQLALHGRLER